jgi:ring-1,2-phenylacetyl-CoA epoxidase subunit PaaC
MTNQEALYTYCLRLGDNALILSHRLSELCSKAPFIEEDLALTNISLDMIGRTQVLLNYAAEVEGKGKTDDDLAYRRAENNYLNTLLVEQDNGDFARTIARQLYLSAFEDAFYTALQTSSDEQLAGLATKTLKEVKYHLQHATDWVIRLGDGTVESGIRMQNALNDLWMFTAELFEMDEVENQLLTAGISVDTTELKEEWMNHITATLKEACLTLPDSTYMQTGGRSGIHSENLGHILSEMQYLQRAYPDAKW